jgi:hypothetical protein
VAFKTLFEEENKMFPKCKFLRLLSSHDYGSRGHSVAGSFVIRTRNEHLPLPTFYVQIACLLDV